MSRSFSPSAPGTPRAGPAGPSGPASHAVSDAATAAARPEGSPPVSSTTPSSDWLAELQVEPDAAPPPGVAIDMKPSTGKSRGGKAIESRRGQR